MKYAVCIDRIKDGQLMSKSIKIMKANDPTILKDALFRVISLQTGVDYRRYNSSRMGVFWDHHNNPNSTDRGCFKIHEYLKDNKEYYICYYRRIRESDTIDARVEDE